MQDESIGYDALSNSTELERLIPLDDLEQHAQALFYTWEQTKSKIPLDDNRIPLSRPQGYTITLPDFMISAKDVFADGEDIAMTKHPRYFTSVLHSHDFFEIVYVAEGHCRQLIDHQEFALERGDLCILPPGVMHAPEAFAPRDLALNLQFRRDAFWNTFGRMLIPSNAISEFFLRLTQQEHPSNYLIFRTGDCQTIRDMVLKMYFEFTEKKHFYYETMQAYSILLFAELMREHERNASVYSVKDNTKNTEIVKIMAYIEDHPVEVSLRTLAERFGYSESHLSRMIKRYTGDNFSVFRRKLRMQKAAILLCCSNDSIEHIATQVGYSSLSDFYGFFRATYHQTPQSYRRNNHEGFTIRVQG